MDEISLGGVSIDAAQICSQLIADQKDDWFPDPLSYKDMAGAQIVAVAINENIIRNQGNYVAGDFSVLNIPKKGFTLRSAVETGLADRAVYHALVASLAPRFDKYIPWNAFSHRYDYLYRGKSKGLRFRNGVESWKHFVGTSRSAVKAGSVVLATDISNFFENIEISLLEKQLFQLCDATLDQSEAESVKKTISSIIELLRHWGHGQHRGLPQNRDASSFLANIYLRHIDLAMIEGGFETTYFRYMDDIRVICTDESQAKKALKKLTIELRSLGLAVNAKKTSIVDSSDPKGMSECFETGSPVIQQMDDLWRRRSRAALFRVWPLLKQHALELIERKRMGEREFKYCLKRLELLARYEDVWFSSAQLADITTAVCQALGRYPEATDLFVEYLRVVEVSFNDLEIIEEYLVEVDKSIYTWQNYRLWMLLAEKGHRTDPLLAAAVSAQAADDTPSRAGASIYLGALGGRDQRLEVAKNFSTAESFLGQRAALISIHELPFLQIRDYVSSRVRDDLRGAFRLLKNGRLSGQYVKAKDPLRIDVIAHEDVYE